MTKNICTVCGKEFEGKYSKNKFCSQQCRSVNWRSTHEEYHQNYRANHVEKVKAWAAKSRDTAREKRHTDSEYREEQNRKKKVYLESHPEVVSKVKATHKAWRKGEGKETFLRTVRKFFHSDKGRNVLKNYLHKRREQKKSDNPLTAQQWRDIQESYHHKCVYCGAGGKMTMEHVIPLSKGGTHTADNVVPACLDCNRKKNRKSLLSFLYQRFSF